MASSPYDFELIPGAGEPLLFFELEAMCELVRSQGEEADRWVEVSFPYLSISMGG
jgi:hypothetical protein